MSSLSILKTFFDPQIFLNHIVILYFLTRLNLFLNYFLTFVQYSRYLYNVLSKNQTVSEGNRGLLVETLRSIAEILIWGDQNDSSVFEFVV